jgi:small-conductance mechanosensitive channel
MNQTILNLKYLHLNYAGLLTSIAILSIAILLTIFIFRRSKKKQKKESSWGIVSLVWIAFFITELFLLVPSFEKIIFYQNKWLIISPIGLTKILAIIFLNIFLLSDIKNWLRKKTLIQDKGALLIFSVVMWLFSFHFIFRILLKHYQKVLSITLFKLQSAKISIYDFFFVALAIALTVFVILLLKIAFSNLSEKGKIDKSTSVTLLNISKYFIWTISIIVTLESIGFNLSVLLAGSAALMVGVGLGIQQVFNDFVSGLILLFEREIKVGDYVEADTVSGTIMDIGFRTTTMLTRDNVKIIIPNSKLVSEKVINWTKGEKYARVGLDVGVAYGSDTHEVKKILKLCATSHKDIMSKPAPEVYFLDFGDSSLDFRLFFYTRKIFYREAIKSDLRFKIYDEFNKAGINIPFPQVDVHMPDKMQ